MRIDGKGSFFPLFLSGIPRELGPSRPTAPVPASPLKALVSRLPAQCAEFLLAQQRRAVNANTYPGSCEPPVRDQRRHNTVAREREATSKTSTRGTDTESATA